MKRLAASLILTLAAALPAAASKVILYTSNNIEQVQAAVSAFEKAHPGIRVDFIHAGSGALMKRLRAEAGNPKADVFWSGGISTISQYSDCFEPYESPEAAAVSERFRDPGHKWLGTNVLRSVVMVNTSALPKGARAPESWKDLTDPSWKGQIIVADPARSSTAYTMLYGLRQLLGHDAFAAIVRNAVLAGTSAGPLEQTARGEFAAGITIEYLANQYVAGGMKEIRLVYPREGVFLMPEGMALIKGAPHGSEAKVLYDFLASRPLQQMLFDKAFRRPLRSDIDTRGKAGLPSLGDVAVFHVDQAQAGRRRSEFLAEFQAIVSGH